MSDALNEIYQSGDYPFYFVAMVIDKNGEAYDRALDGYNCAWIPTGYFDGGYRTLIGGNEPFRDAIESCGEREVIKLDMSLSARWVGATEIGVNVTVLNNDVGEYDGHIRVYIVEPHSRWNDYSGDPYHFGFIGWAFNEPITLAYGESFEGTSTWDGSEHGYDDITPDNIMVIAAVFNGEAHQGYSDPPGGNPFDAYYVDQAMASIPSEDKSPPSVEIAKPAAGTLYISGREIMKIPSQSALIVGGISVEADASDSGSGIGKVEFYVDGNLVASDDGPPYEWNWNITSIFQKHTLKVVAYDAVGNTASTETEAIIFSLG